MPLTVQQLELVADMYDSDATESGLEDETPDTGFERRRTPSTDSTENGGLVLAYPHSPLYSSDDSDLMDAWPPQLRKYLEPEDFERERRIKKIERESQQERQRLNKERQKLEQEANDYEIARILDGANWERPKRNIKRKNYKV